MPDPAEITTSSCEILRIVLQSATSLRSATEGYEDRDRTLRRLQNELRDLTTALKLLIEVSIQDSALVPPMGPIEGCSELCRRFELSIKAFSTKSTTRFRDWTKMECMGFGINDYIDRFEGYKYTMLVALGVARKHCVLSYREIQETKYNLKLQLQRIDEKSAQFLTENNVLDSSAELKEERTTIEQCIGICGQAASNYSTLSSLAPSFTISCLSEEDEEERTNILSSLQKEEPSQPLRRFLERLKLGSPVWDISIFAKYLRKLAYICGPGREEYHENELKGLHYPASFIELWNQTYRQLPITASDDDFHFQWVCPLGWTPEIRQSCIVYSYYGEAPLSEGLCDILAGPATLDCGMRTQLFFWMTTIGVFGDKLFHEKFRFAKGEFVLTQGLYVRYDGIRGNPLLPYFDPTLGPEVESKPEEPQMRIQIKAIFNASTYILKHPGGTARLQNVIQINEQYIIHQQPSTKSSLSATELDENLRQAYNTPRTDADKRELWRWGHSSAHIVHAQLDPKSFGDLFKEAEGYAHHMLDVLEWNQTRDERKMESDKYRLEFNFERLKHHMEQTMLMTGRGLLQIR